MDDQASPTSYDDASEQAILQIQRESGPYTISVAHQFDTLFSKLLPVNVDKRRIQKERSGMRPEELTVFGNLRLPDGDHPG
jgi:hypothetical protein